MWAVGEADYAFDFYCPCFLPSAHGHTFNEWSLFSLRNDNARSAFFFCSFVSFLESIGMKVSSSSNCVNYFNNAWTDFSPCFLTPALDDIWFNKKHVAQFYRNVFLASRCMLVRLLLAFRSFHEMAWTFLNPPTSCPMRRATMIARFTMCYGCVSALH